MKMFLKSFFKYNYQINQAIADRFKSYNNQLDGEINRLANHMMNAHQILLSRINGNGLLKSPWEIFPLETFSERNQKLFDQTIVLLDSRDLEEVIIFKTFSGVEFEKKISDILIHIVNHSTYHRGQIALLMRTKGLEPVTSDYIHWKS